MIERHLLRLRARDEISDEEAEAIRGAVVEYRDYPAGSVVIPAGVELTVSTLLLDGMLSRFKDLRDGERQITELHVPGDFADLHSFTLKRLDHAVMALTPCRVAIVPHDNLMGITERFPHLTRVYWFLTNLDAAIHREWEVSLGRRTSLARLACLFCELYLRLKIVGLTNGLSFPLRITQANLAECLGLTPVHINRTLRELRQQNLATFRSGTVTIHDLERMIGIAEFDDAYLYLLPRSR